MADINEMVKLIIKQSQLNMGENFSKQAKEFEAAGDRVSAYRLLSAAEEVVKYIKSNE